MNSQIFGCPGCNQRFQVLSQYAGQIVQCPTCAQSVGIPADAFANSSDPAPLVNQPTRDPVASSLIYRCASCGGQFGITADMSGTQVACPHCHVLHRQYAVAIESEPSPADEPIIEIQTQPKLKRRKISIEPIPESTAEIAVPSVVRKRKTGYTPPAVPLQPDVRQSDLAPPPKPPPNPPALPSSVSPPPKTAPFVTRQPPQVAVQPLSTPAAVASTNVAAGPIERVPEPSSQAELFPTSDDLSDVSLVSETISIDHLLPPRFNVGDPGRIRLNDPDDFKVFLPDGEGGSKPFDQRVLHVEHGGEKVSLVALSPRQRFRRRLISNTIAILVGIAILAIAFWLLS
jgi:DNA-directed RNA polymerase subunit RPC12/RpoP